MILALSRCPACQGMLTLNWGQMAMLLRWSVHHEDWTAAAWLRRMLREGRR